MDDVAIISRREPSVEELFDADMTAGRAYAAAPNPEQAKLVAQRYEKFYVAFTGSAMGLDIAVAELERKMARTAVQIGGAGIR